MPAGINVHRLVTGTIGKALKERFPDFHIMGEPGWISLRLPDGSINNETITVFRENPFRGEQQPHAAVLAALCERHPDGNGSHVADLIHRIAASDGTPETDVAKRWFERFLDVAIAPFMIAQGDYGLLLALISRISFLASRTVGRMRSISVIARVQVTSARSCRFCANICLKQVLLPTMSSAVTKLLN
ncbi:hypothetical protein HED54_22930 [Ochrobactrum anthropi ATCC 49188]|nr:hypothetical protein [Brucella anthropi ATCC 49188]